MKNSTVNEEQNYTSENETLMTALAEERKGNQREERLRDIWGASDCEGCEAGKMFNVFNTSVRQRILCLLVQ